MHVERYFILLNLFKQLTKLFVFFMHVPFIFYVNIHFLKEVCMLLLAAKSISFMYLKINLNKIYKKWYTQYKLLRDELIIVFILLKYILPLYKIRILKDNNTTLNNY